MDMEEGTQAPKTENTINVLIFSKDPEMTQSRPYKTSNGTLIKLDVVDLSTNVEFKSLLFSRFRNADVLVVDTDLCMEPEIFGFICCSALTHIPVVLRGSVVMPGGCKPWFDISIRYLSLVEFEIIENIPWETIDNRAERKLR